jgi:RHS repeat-associated protein
MSRVNSGTTAYAYDNADRITSVTKPGPTVVNHTWDDNGNLTARGGDTFAWDVEDRMTSATVGGTATTFAYRGDGLRASRTTGGATTTFTWDVNAGLPVVLDDGNQYVYGAGLVSQKQGGNWSYYLADGLGSTMAIVDASGTVQDSYTYDVYGKPTKTGTLANDFDFAGQQTDGTGLQYLRARYMDPETGTFMNRDRLAAQPVWTGNPFGYGNANPANVADPSGLCGWDILSCGADVVNAVKSAFDSTMDAARAAGDAIAEGAGWTAERVAAIAAGAAAMANDGIGKLASATNVVARAVWHVIRAAVNADLSRIAMLIAGANGLSCRALRNGLTGCFGAKFLDGSALTLGNVILVKDYDIGGGLLDHEERHADQWAMFGLATPGHPLAGQAVMGMTYVGLSAKFGPCGNPFERLADFADGGYDQCID